MAQSTAPLFTPFTLGSMHLPNRIVMAPMTRGQSPGGIPGPNVAAYYRRRAEHGVGLILTEGTAIDHPAALSMPAVPEFHGNEALAGWARVLREVHEAGGRIMPQLWHVGMQRKPGSEPHPEAPPIGPSGMAGPDKPVSPPMSEADIVAAVGAYARSAGHAHRLGFDGIELHGAHGYLIDQFFWEGTNRRTDRYGGSIRARTRFAVEIIETCRQATAPDFPIILRFSQWKIPQYEARLVTTPDELAEFLEPLTTAGVDAFHCSTRRFWEPEFDGSNLNLAGWTKKLTGKPTITVGSVGLNEEFMSGFTHKQGADNVGVDQLVAMVEAGEVDLVAVGRALLVDSAWAEKIRDERLDDLMPFDPEALKTLS